MTAIEKPRVGFWSLWNISFGFFGIQIGFALQIANMSRVFQTLGASMDDLPALWVAAPLTGLIVQPIIGYLSDKTWNRLGRRRPYFLTGAIFASLSLVVMPLSPSFAAPLFFAAAMLWILDAALNVSMEPFRAFVGDMLRTDQHSAGYAAQTAFIGAGAMIGSIFPFLLETLGVTNIAPDGGVPDTVKYSFWFGAFALFVAVGWTVLTTREFSPEQMASFANEPAADDANESYQLLGSRSLRTSMLWIAFGLIVSLVVWQFDLEKEMYLLATLLTAYGILSMIVIVRAKRGQTANMLASIVGDFSGMPDIMKRLAVVQFFSWSALFIMWINTTPVVTQYVFGSSDPTSTAYNDGANWVTILFTMQNGVAMVAALTFLPRFAARYGQAKTHTISLMIGAIGFAMFFVLRDAYLLVIAEIAIGIAWASILAMPYAILASNLPQSKRGVYMGLFNIFIVIPQLLVATIMGQLMLWLFPSEPIWTMLFAAVAWLIASLAMLRVASIIPAHAR